MKITMDETFTLNDVIKKLHKEGASGRLDFDEVKFTVCDGLGCPFVKIEYPQDEECCGCCDY